MVMDAEAWNARYGASEMLWGVEPNRWVVAETADLVPGEALDVACGEGRNAVWLADRGWAVTGVDFSTVALDRARDLASQAGAEIEARLTWVQSDAHDSSGWGGPFDLVLMAYLHLPAHERQEALLTAVGVLAPGGTMLVVGHDLSNLTEGVGGPQDAELLLTPESVVAALRDVPGLEVERAERVVRLVETPEGEHKAVDTLVRVRRLG